MVFYWITLPLSLLVWMGWLAGAVMDPADTRSWLMSAGAAALAAVIGWRLWLNSRSVGWSGPIPQTRRLLLVFLPLTVLAIAGTGVAATGLAVLALGVGLLASPDTRAVGTGGLAMGAALYLGGGVLIVLVGAALTFPLLRSLGRKPAPVDSF